MTAHQDVAGVVGELRRRHEAVTDNGVTLAGQAATLIESLSKALSEAEAEIARLKEVDSTFNELASYSNTLAARAEAAESRLAEAMKAIEPFARLATQHDEARSSGECGSWIDFLMDFHWPSEGDCVAARRFLNAGKE